VRRCAKCRFADVAVVDEDYGPFLVCRRYPPTLVEVDTGPSGREQGVLAWVPVQSDDWCGEWQEAFDEQQRS
jgi:hypothetical protein